jgi:hypothetical protein
MCTNSDPSRNRSEPEPEPESVTGAVTHLTVSYSPLVDLPSAKPGLSTWTARERVALGVADQFANHAQLVLCL